MPQVRLETGLVRPLPVRERICVAQTGPNPYLQSGGCSIFHMQNVAGMWPKYGVSP